MRFRGSLLVAALMVGVLAAPLAHAEELSLDAQSLDTSGVPAKSKGKKASKAKQQQNAPTAAAKASGTPGGDRQFGELEGWSPGKAPPKKKEDDNSSSGPAKGPVGVSPTGSMSVGLPF
ncbi:hypothetical protein [Methylocystis heyeri]|uniref:Uncharacterized protein n=1 Tax=Methylocystis heyeri TaxID=391905 RepID=A0A6B8KAJ3_9HYPH|nr:hypothetical protein [Methylocystis heyeri]QGM44757.1 hypothetical protein H2LOC_003100 [Methylocystis heyeri]